MLCPLKLEGAVRGYDTITALGCSYSSSAVTYISGQDGIRCHEQPSILAIHKVVVDLLTAGPDVCLSNIKVCDGICQPTLESKELLALLCDAANLHPRHHGMIMIMIIMRIDAPGAEGRAAVMSHE